MPGLRGGGAAAPPSLLAAGRAAALRGRFTCAGGADRRTLEGSRHRSAHAGPLPRARAHRRAASAGVTRWRDPRKLRGGAAQPHLDDAAPPRGGLGRLQQAGVGVGRCRWPQAAAGEALHGTYGRNAAPAFPPPAPGVQGCRLRLLFGTVSGVGRSTARRRLLSAASSLCHRPAERCQLLRGAERAGESHGRRNGRRPAALLSRHGGGSANFPRRSHIGPRGGGCPRGTPRSQRSGAGDADNAQEVRPQPRAVVTGAGLMLTDGELGQSAARPPPGGAAAANGPGEGRARGTPGRAVGAVRGGRLGRWRRTRNTWSPPPRP